MGPAAECFGLCCGRPGHDHALSDLVGVPNFIAMERLAESPDAVVLFYGVGFGLLVALTMTHFLYVAELYPTQVRNLGIGLSYNIGLCIFGGLSPVRPGRKLEPKWALRICERLYDQGAWAPGLFHAASGIISILTILLSLWLQRRGILRLAHIRDVVKAWGSRCQAAKDQSPTSSAA